MRVNDGRLKIGNLEKRVTGRVDLKLLVLSFVFLSLQLELLE